mmetsp:Transcript_59327/g.154210  ORF Transcript_59327/g.154210 Transcript_59327/m.154210 type:complete len:333 (+) Transcript_59327:947-1945(+)
MDAVLAEIAIVEVYEACQILQLVLRWSPEARRLDGRDPDPLHREGADHLADAPRPAEGLAREVHEEVADLALHYVEQVPQRDQIVRVDKDSPVRPGLKQYLQVPRLSSRCCLVVANEVLVPWVWLQSPPQGPRQRNGGGDEERDEAGGADHLHAGGSCVEAAFRGQRATKKKHEQQGGEHPVHAVRRRAAPGPQLLLQDEEGDQDHKNDADLKPRVLDQHRRKGHEQTPQQQHGAVVVPPRLVAEVNEAHRVQLAVALWREVADDLWVPQREDEHEGEEGAGHEDARGHGYDDHREVLVADVAQQRWAGRHRGLPIRVLQVANEGRQARQDY